jgi:Ca2+/H+ antiporter, TMEM165/GDT1 family
MEGFWLSLFLIFLAEMGDKSQLVVLTLATRFKAGVVLAGVLVATLLIKAFSVVLGSFTGRLLPPGWLPLLCGLAFVGFGVWILRGDTTEDGNGRLNRLKSPVLIVAATVFLAEIGDKTMLATVTLAARYSLLQVWLGSTLGFVLADALAIGVGMKLGRRLPEKAIRMGAAAIFFGVGLYYAAQGLGRLW